MVFPYFRIGNKLLDIVLHWHPMVAISASHVMSYSFAIIVIIGCTHVTDSIATVAWTVCPWNQLVTPGALKIRITVTSTILKEPILAFFWNMDLTEITIPSIMTIANGMSFNYFGVTVIIAVMFLQSDKYHPASQTHLATPLVTSQEPG